MSKKSSEPSYTPDRKLDANYFAGLNEHLLKQVPNAARRILDVGCANGRLGHALKMLRSDREVFGVERIKDAAAEARAVLDDVFEIDVTRETLPLAAGSIDCILFGDVLEHIYDPVDVLDRLRLLLQPEGSFLCSIPNVQHFSALFSIVAGDFQYQPNGLLDRDHLRFFGAANVQKMFLDAGCLPNFPDAIMVPYPPQVLEVMMPLCSALGLDPDLFARKLAIYQHICQAKPLPEVRKSSAKITFIVNITRPLLAQNNFLSSPILRSDRHEVVKVSNAKSAAETLRVGLEHSRLVSDLVVLVQEDVYLPARWDDRLVSGIDEAERTFGPVGAAGVYGVSRQSPDQVERVGKIVDRLTLINTPHQLPKEALSLDESVVALRRSSAEQIALDHQFGFNFYGSEVCLSVRSLGQAAAVVEAPCLLNSEAGDRVSGDLYRSAQLFVEKQSGLLPYATTRLKLHSRDQLSTWEVAS